MAVVHIEFDYLKYPTCFSAIQWIRTSPYAHLEQRKDFKLKVCPRSVFLSKENRKVYAWTNEAWMYEAFTAERPENHIYILKADSAKHWNTQDIPSPSAKFLQKEQEASAKRDQKDRSLESRRIKLAEARKRREALKKQKSSSIVEDPAEVEEKKKFLKEESRKRKRADKQQTKMKRTAIKKSKKAVPFKKKKEDVEPEASSDEESDSQKETEVEKIAKGYVLMKGKTLTPEILSEVEAPKDALSV